MCLLDSNATFPTVVFGEAFLVYFTKDSNCCVFLSRCYCCATIKLIFCFATLKWNLEDDVNLE